MNGYRKQNESLLSRAFWRFIGGALLILAGIVICVSCFSDVNNHYPLKILTSLGVCLMLISGAYPWLLPNKKRSFALPIISSTLITLLILRAYTFQLYEVLKVILIFASLFSTISNGFFLYTKFEKRRLISSISILLIGASIMIFGIVFTESQKEVVFSSNINNEIVLVQGDTIQVGPYFANYVDVNAGVQKDEYIIELFEISPQKYPLGQIVEFNKIYFRSIKEHLASNRFINDLDENWSILPFPSSVQIDMSQSWISGTPGKLIFTATPFKCKGHFHDYTYHSLLFGFQISVKEDLRDTPIGNVVIIKSVILPLLEILWLGGFFLIIGIFFLIYQIHNNNK